MKKKIIKLLSVAIIAITLTSCRGCVSSYAEQREGVKKVCPTCNLVTSENTYYAVDTAKHPNIIYKVRFCAGGLYYKASDVDELIRVN